MATKKKFKKTTSKKTAKSVKAKKKQTPKKASAKKPAAKVSAAKKNAALRKRLVTKPFVDRAPKPAPPKAISKPAARVSKRGKQQDVETVSFEPKGLGPRSGGQSGDLQGLSNRAGADSESVDELLEEGNAFEAQVVKGVEDVPDADEGEIRTREVPEDDVPGEYDDQ